MIDWTQVKTAEQIEAERIEGLAVSVRAERDRLLVGSDWTQVSDAPVDAGVWRAYRQALRDVPDQEGFPESVVWPEVPGV